MSYGYGQPQFAPYQPAYQQPGYAHQPRQSAPPSVHIVAVLQYLGGLMLLLAAGIFAFLGANPSTEWTTSTDFIDAETAPKLAFAAAGVIALIGLIALVFGRKLQRGRQWARVLILLLSTLSLAAGGYSIVVQGDPTAVAGMIFPALYLILLNTRAARSWFRAHTW